MNDDHTPARSPRGRRARRGRIALAAALAVAGPLLWVVLHSVLGIFFNVTTSLPSGLYRLREAAPEVGTVMMSCLEEEPSAMGLARLYLGPGDCPFGTAPVAKVIAAMAGDTVLLTRAGVVVRGHLLPRSAPSTVDSRGHPLPDVRGMYVLKPGEVWLYSGYDPKSFDSRYYGPVPDSLLLGEAFPLWTWGTTYEPLSDLGFVNSTVDGVP